MEVVLSFGILAFVHQGGGIEKERLRRARIEPESLGKTLAGVSVAPKEVIAHAHAVIRLGPRRLQPNGLLEQLKRCRLFISPLNNPSRQEQITRLPGIKRHSLSRLVLGLGQAMQQQISTCQQVMVLSVLGVIAARLE